jgi:hypothetical protein
LPATKSAESAPPTPRLIHANPYRRPATASHD